MTTMTTISYDAGVGDEVRDWFRNRGANVATRQEDCACDPSGVCPGWAGAGSSRLGKTVASGDLGGVPANLLASAQTWFVNGLSWVLAICGIVCALGALIAFATIRGSDLRTDEVGTEVSA